MYTSIWSEKSHLKDSSSKFNLIQVREYERKRISWCLIGQELLSTDTGKLKKKKTLAFEKKENRLCKFFIFDLKPDVKQSFPLCSELSQPCARSLTREVSCKIKSSPPLFDTLCNMLRLASFVWTWYALIREKHSVSQLSSIVAKSVNFWQKLWKRSWFIRRMWPDSKSLEKIGQLVLTLDV